MIHMTLNCVDLTQSSVIRIIHRGVGMKYFFNYLNVCFIVRFSFIYASQGSVKTYLRCGEIYNNHVIANCPPIVPIKKF